MARVFISYRRADGQYAVGWIEERLGQLDEVTSVRTAFRDNTTLRLGDDLPDVLASEVEDCDVLIAVIGPHWRGERPDGTSRIIDPNDWVAREILLALEHGKRIVPVLINGMEPLDADTLTPELQPLTELLALRFHDVEDLDRLDEEVRVYLDGLDRERARLYGLDEPIEVPSARQPWWVWLVAVVAAVVSGFVWLEWCSDGDEWSAVGVGMWVCFGVIGVSYFRRVMSGIIDVRWQTVLRTGALALILLGLTVRAFPPGDNDRVIANIVQGSLAIVLLSPWIVMMLGVSWSTTSAVSLRDRARVIAIHRRNLDLATPVVVLALSLSVVSTAQLFDADLEDGSSWWEPGSKLISFGVFLTLIVLAALVYSTRSLRSESDLIRVEIADLAPVYRRNVEAALVDEPLDHRWPLVWLAFAPTITAVGAIVILVRTT